MATTADRALRRWRTDPGRLSAAVLVGGAAFIAAYFLAFDTATKDLLYQVPGMIAPIGVVAGILRYRPADPKPWIALAVGLTLTVMGDWTFVILDRMGLELFPSVADALYLGGLVDHRRRDHRAPARPDPGR